MREAGEEKYTQKAVYKTKQAWEPHTCTLMFHNRQKKTSNRLKQGSDNPMMCQETQFMKAKILWEIHGK